MRFVKMEGLGNDFVVVDGPFAPTADQVASWCDRHRGIGADGVLVVTAGDPISMEYWNADGSPAEMCGNGLRCVARYARMRGDADRDEFDVATPVGIRSVGVSADSVRVSLGRVSVAATTETAAGVELRRVEVGNPHAVVLVNDVESTAVEDLGPVISSDARFPSGVNVGFAAVTDRNRLRLRVWERGVGETLACGTGAAAAAAAASAAGLTDSVVTVTLSGGDLSVEISSDGAWIDGPARVVYEGTIG
ncbi:MAG: diaminopimelate epimerase [Acidimicrobiia bacterium]